MDIEGLWTFSFISDIRRGGGVIVLEKGKIIGGNSSFWMKGTYEREEHTGFIHGTLISTRYETLTDSVYKGVAPNVGDSFTSEFIGTFSKENPDTMIVTSEVQNQAVSTGIMSKILGLPAEIEASIRKTTSTLKIY